MASCELFICIVLADTRLLDALLQMLVPYVALRLISAWRLIL